MILPGITLQAIERVAKRKWTQRRLAASGTRSVEPIGWVVQAATTVAGEGTMDMTAGMHTTLGDDLVAAGGRVGGTTEVGLADGTTVEADLGDGITVEADLGDGTTVEADLGDGITTEADLADGTTVEADLGVMGGDLEGTIMAVDMIPETAMGRVLRTGGMKAPDIAQSTGTGRGLDVTTARATLLPLGVFSRRGSFYRRNRKTPL